MSATALLEELRDRGVELVADGGRLRYRPTSSVTPELLNRRKEHKPSLLKLLEWQRRQLEDADQRGFVARQCKEPG